eukprot:929740-Prymnesium_polylepis.1
MRVSTYPQGTVRCTLHHAPNVTMSSAFVNRTGPTGRTPLSLHRLPVTGERDVRSSNLEM